MSDEQTKTTKTVGRPAPILPQAPREWDPFASLHREMDNLFNSFRSGIFRLPSLPGGAELDPFFRRAGGQGIAPAVDIVENEKHYELTAELPGLQPEQVDVKLANGVLTIKGEKKEEKEEQKEGYYLSERRFGSFQRSFTVPEGVDEDNIAAEFKNGVLRITMPKSPEVQQKEKKIAIQSR